MVLIAIVKANQANPRLMFTDGKHCIECGNDDGVTTKITGRVYDEITRFVVDPDEVKRNFEEGIDYEIGSLRGTVEEMVKDTGFHNQFWLSEFRRLGVNV